MNIVIALLAAGSVAATVVMIIAYLMWPSEKNRLKSRLRDFQQLDGEVVEDVAASQSALKAKDLPVVGPMIAAAEKRLANAGFPNNVTAETFVAMQGLAAIGLPFLYLGPKLAARSLSLQDVLITVVVGVVGYRLPIFWLSKQVTARKKSIEKLLPDALDLVTVCAEAGLSVDAALMKVVEKWRGPLSDELRLTMGEVNFGRPRREALRDMAKRADVPDLNSFVVALVQSEQMGISVGKILRTLGGQLRTRRRQRAQEAAQKAPIKMLFPLILFIFPALFIMVLGPAIMEIGKMFAATS